MQSIGWYDLLVAMCLLVAVGLMGLLLLELQSKK